ncbi:MAG: ATP-binding protein [Planctomycetota bacterium]
MAAERGGRRLPLPLALKLGLALLGTALLTLAVLFGSAAPRVKRDFVERSNRLIELTQEAMQDLVQTSAQQSRELLLELQAHAADARRRRLLDLPLSLYGADTERVRQAVIASDQLEDERHQRHVELIEQEIRRRWLAQVDASLAQLDAAQASLAASFAADARRSYLLFCGAVFAALCLLLGGGLYATIIRPVRRLRAATNAVAHGSLAPLMVPSAADEVGDLARDFAAMAQALRASRAAIEQHNAALATWNERLGAEVGRKTQHLEDALRDLRRAQEDLIKVEKMASIGRLAGGVAHEFNNLIAGIRGCAEDLLSDARDAGLVESLNVILRATQRGSRITDELLRFSGPRPVRRKQVDVLAVLNDAVALVEADARKRSITIVRELEQPAETIADGDALHQVFLNLLSNAIQAMPHGGELRIACGVTDQAVSVRVADTGIGISPDDLPRLFEPFFSRREGCGRPGGTGLGLAVSYGIVQAHAGKIEVASELGRGSAFTVVIPRTSALR